MLTQSTRKSVRDILKYHRHPCNTNKNAFIITTFAYFHATQIDEFKIPQLGQTIPAKSKLGKKRPRDKRTASISSLQQAESTNP